MSDFESELAGTPRRGAPAEWRGEILRAARAAGAEAPKRGWWRQWLAPQPLSLGAAWLVIATLRLATPEPAQAGKANVERVRELSQARQKLLVELLNPAPPAAPPHRQEGAMILRRRNQLA